MLSLDRFFPAEVLAWTTDRAIDFKLAEESGGLKPEQKEFLSRQLGFAANVATMRQVHGDEILILPQSFSDREDFPKADGMVTSRQQVPLTVRTADCLSVFFFDRRTKSIGLAHAGWRGTQKNIAAKMVRVLNKEYGVQPQDLTVVLGPAIRKCCYQVGEEFGEYFPTAVQRDARGLYLDLLAVNAGQLSAEGVCEKNIHDAGICTHCDERFFSFRREGEKTGRLLSLIMVRSS